MLIHPVISGLLASVRETGRSETWRQYHFVLYMQEKLYIHICKESRNRPGVAQRVPGGLGSRIS
jgi:hypothetical protein